jgi:hypothetical protein
MFNVQRSSLTDDVTAPHFETVIDQQLIGRWRKSSMALDRSQ